ncbi:Non-heme 11 kDa protein of cytochrome bc1 complex [Suhomyces tanzawaensis NRRL Y-17324]|uniref:Cytochrome b-c1 complex subunit 6, mitochondrial n=1 Tax=Suhomyces tanzawaensis NRRL Y-17324 TaxID=984487 RepID=A0A1E4SNF2_9ASCO|nr:Non-heme 11 kDa protein of cytochrome bc1 complex [Suhomyces tanzawaensis NRRL Y-17324]ODV81043.1 Non-heme 11 kDa protein of cytochrome bc1 complex [Suhomyces tanzawaensis NRRL Y-17324]
MSFFRDLIETVLPAAYAEEVKSEETEESEDAEEGDDDEDEDDEDDEDEDEEEVADPLDTLREECQDTPACKPFNHHFHECVERVTKEQEEEDYEHKAYKEDCVEEFFHLHHCINDCVAPRLFNKLK